MKTMRAMKKEAVAGALTLLSAEREVFCPVRSEGAVSFRRLSPGEAPCFDSLLPGESIKEAVFPQTEEILSFSGIPSSAEVHPAPEPSPRLVFGGPPCDAKALLLLDRVFLEGEFEDEMYKKRRASATIISKACSSPDEFCFCTAFDSSPASPDGSDAIFFESGDEFVFLPVTEKGEKAVREISAAAKKAGYDEARSPQDPGEENSWLRQLDEMKNASLPLGNGVRSLLSSRDEEGGLASWLLSNFDLPLWEEISRRCLGCGACTYVCPTCHCFAVVDSPRGARGRRYRVWDSCKFQEFLLMAGGHNPRPTKKERARQRFMHKLSYYPQRYGNYLCVGCGRCVRTCKAGIHVPGVLSEVTGPEANAQRDSKGEVASR